MKTALISLILSQALISVPATATSQEVCNGNTEAQIVAQVVEMVTDSLTYCKARITEESVAFFMENQNCPLSLPDIIETGISYPLKNGHDCDGPKGNRLTGILIKDKNTIYLEN